MENMGFVTRRENILRAVRFETPDHIPMTFAINASCWHRYPQDALLELMADHKYLFPDFVAGQAINPIYGPNERAGQPFTDDWGCQWRTTEDGICGTVTKHPLENWDAFESYVAPDPLSRSGLGPCDWGAIAENVRQARCNGELVGGWLRHGHTFLLLCDIRGYQNLLYDMIDDDPRVSPLIGLVEDFNMAVVTKYVELGVEWMGYPEDLGMQVGPMLSPDLFHRYIKPSFQRIMKPARDAGCVIHMHSDGDIRSLLDDLIDGGVEVMNLQDLVNGIDWIAEKLAGRVCIDLDIDRQEITPYGTPQQIDELIRSEVSRLSSKRGGLMMVYGLYPGVPLENVRAVMDAMERYADYHA